MSSISTFRSHCFSRICPARKNPGSSPRCWLDDASACTASRSSRTSHYHLPAWPRLDLADALSGWCYGYSFDAVRPLDVIGRIAPRLLLLIHGADDRMIPVDHAHRLCAAVGSGTDLRIIGGAQHCAGYYLDRAGYIREVTDFFAATLSAPESVGAGV